MERLTYWCDNGHGGGKWFVAIDAEGREDYGPHVDRLAAYEETGLEPGDFKRAFSEDTILKLAGQALGITPDRLRELAQADKEGRCVVMPCQPGDKVSYKSSTGFWCNAVIKDYTPENIFITAETEIPNAEPLSHTFSILEIEAALRREKE